MRLFISTNLGSKVGTLYASTSFCINNLTKNLRNHKFYNCAAHIIVEIDFLQKMCQCGLGCRQIMVTVEFKFSIHHEQNHVRLDNFVCP